jgi:glyoxylase-like metal-dependent hydrolase (beta-lactamase superfamily II)
MWRDEWDFWTGPADLSNLPLPDQSKASLVALAKRSLLPIESQVDLIDEVTTVAPGIQIIAAPGHTPGHAAVLVSSGSDQLLWSGDAILHPFHVCRPEWYSTFDLDPDKAVAIRRALLARAADEGMLLHGSHFPWPGLGHVARQNDRFLWEPVKS